MAALLVNAHTVRDAAANVNFGHQSAEVLRVVRKVIQIWGVEVVDVTRLVGSPVGPGDAGVEDYIQRLSTRQRDGIGRVIQVVAGLISQQLGVVTDDLHRNAEGGKRLIFGDIQIGDAQQGFAANRDID